MLEAVTESAGAQFHPLIPPEEQSVFTRNTGVDAYLVYRAAVGLGDTVEDRQTEVAVGGYGLRSGTLLLDEATQDLLTFAYASGDYAVLVSHAATGDPKEIVTLPLDRLDDYRASGHYHGIDVV